MELSSVFQQLGIALGLGLLVGLQRERTDSRLAGVRTFPLVTVLGTLCGQLSDSSGGWVIGFGLVALSGVIVVGNLREPKTAERHPGLTSEIAMLVMFLVGAYLSSGHEAAAVAVGGGVAVLLHLKPQMHAAASKIGERDFKAIMQFVLISLVILPVLPNRFFGPYGVLNPHQIWWMVVLIVGISLGGYIVYKLFGEKAGTLVGGILGGLISSTATTVSYARRSRQPESSAGLAAVVIMVASTVVFLRVLILINVAAPEFLKAAGPPFAIMLAAGALLSAGLWLLNRKEHSRMPEQENPTELKTALLFGLLYAIVLIAAAAAKDYFGERGLYLVSVASGLADMDAITLSISQLVRSGNLEGQTGWRLILVAAMSNLVFKSLVVAFLGEFKLFKRVAALFLLAFGVGVLLLLLWPG